METTSQAVDLYTLSGAYQQIVEEDVDPWVALGNFMNDFLSTSQIGGQICFVIR